MPGCALRTEGRPQRLSKLWGEGKRGSVREILKYLQDKDCTMIAARKMVLIAVVASVAACGQPEPEPITPVVIYNKYGSGPGGGGGGECVPEDRYVSGQTPRICDTPDEQPPRCYDPGAPAGSSVEIPCPPPRGSNQREEGGDEGGGNVPQRSERPERPRSPTGAIN